MPEVRFGFSRWAIMLVVSCQLLLVTPSRTRASFNQANTVKVLGDFSRIRYPGDDAFGYSLKLWQEGNQIFGLLTIFTGAPADPPTGILEDVKFDPRTKRFSFSARLSTGWVHEEDKWNPTRDRYSFSGVLTRREVTGTLKHSDELRAPGPLTFERIRLRRSVDGTKSMSQPASYAEWKLYADKILRFRGPRW